MSLDTTNIKCNANQQINLNNFNLITLLNATPTNHHDLNENNNIKKSPSSKLSVNIQTLTPSSSSDIETSNNRKITNDLQTPNGVNGSKKLNSNNVIRKQQRLKSCKIKSTKFGKSPPMLSNSTILNLLSPTSSSSSGHHKVHNNSSSSNQVFF